MSSPFSAVIPADFSGVVHVVQGGDVLHSQAYGFADVANERPNRVDTRFPTASAGKAIVAVGVLKLVADGRLTLDARLGDLLDVDLQAISPDVTVRHLLTHTSGIADYFDESEMDDYAALWTDLPCYRVRTGADLLPTFAGKPMKSAPGETFAYNNGGYVVLGMVLEAVTGQPLDAYLTEAVLTPAGTTSSGWFELDRLPGNCANAYITDEESGEQHSNIYSVPAKGLGDGGAFLTVGDVERFWTALLGGDLIPAELVTEALAVQATGVDEDGDEEHYGYGFWLGGDSGQVPFFTGEDPGVAFMSSCTGGNLIVVVSNTGDDVWEIHSEMRDLLTGDESDGDGDGDA